MAELTFFPPALMPPSPPAPNSTSLSRKVAHVLDALVKIPGSNRRIGLDPIIGLIPGVGDALSAALGSIILLEAMRCKVPRLLMMRMTGNVMINAVVGAIPLLGDLFSVWFQSNSKNSALLHAWQSGGKRIPASPQTKWVVAGCLGLILVAAALVALGVWLLSALWRWITG
jgi:hypothetical protein